MAARAGSGVMVATAVPADRATAAAGPAVSNDRRVVLLCWSRDIMVYPCVARWPTTAAGASWWAADSGSARNSWGSALGRGPDDVAHCGGEAQREALSKQPSLDASAVVERGQQRLP